MNPSGNPRRRQFAEFGQRALAWLRGVWTALVPTPRRSLRARDALLPLGFLALYLGLILFLAFTNRVMFVQPAMFGLLAFVPWIWWLQFAGYGGLPQTRGQISLAVRLALVAICVTLLAEPRAVRTSDELAVVYAVDVSDSIGDQSVQAALEFVTRTVAEKPPKDRAGMLVFGRSAAVELPPRQSFPLDERLELNTRVERDATNLEQALSLSAAMIPSESAGRIVLISDGTQTEGSLERTLDELKSRGIAVDVLPIQYQYEDEVWLERLELPRFVKLGQEYEAVVVLSSLKAGKGKLTLTENGRPILEQEVEFQAGKNQYVLPISLRTAGYYEYAASIEVSAQADHLKQNNTVLNYIFVDGEGKALLVTDPTGDQRDWQSLAQAIKESERLVEVISARDFPRDALALMPYDAVVFVNVAADQFDPVQMQAVKDATYDLGIGFLMVGGQNSFGPGGWHRTAVEETLPVTMDITQKKILPKGALAIILHTCEFPSGNSWAKKITIQAIKVLGAQDEVGCLNYEFQNGEGWIFPLTPAREIDMMIKKINASEPGDMPSFATTMQLGLTGLKASDAATKHMIIISDGDPSPPAPSLVQDFIDNKVSVSMVAVFPHGNIEQSSMKAIAEATGGRYYFPQDPNQLPSIFIKESKTLKRSMIQNKDVVPEVAFPSDILKGIDEIPILKGYVLTSVKERLTETVLKVPQQEEEQVDPLLATWSFGLGRAAAFTSDLSPNWGAEWVNWAKYQAFVKQLMINISRVRKQGHLRMWSYTAGNQGVILVEDFAPETTFLDVKARVSGPRELSETISLKQVGPRRYQANVPLWGRGRYQVVAAASAGDRKDQALDGFIVPYSPEYLRFRSNPIELKDIAAKTGGAELGRETTAKEIYLDHRQPKSSSRPVFDWFLLAAACLLPLDVAIRRVQLDFSGLRRWLTFKKEAPKESTAAMSALLKRKQEVGASLEARKEESRPLSPPTGTPRPITGAGKPPVPTNPAAPPAAPPPPEKPPEEKRDTTTSRLLDRKRKRQTGEEE